MPLSESASSSFAKDRLDLCQFQCNGAFAGAKQYRKAPMMIAEEVCRALAMEEIFEKAEAVCSPQSPR